jgi:hypothetical protein
LLHPCLQRLSPYLTRPLAIQESGEISTDITSDEYAYSWHRTRECTTSGKSGIHFGHMKASCLHPTLAETDCLFLEISLKSGYTLNRWKQCIDLCIPKKVDSIRVNKLRTICLVECDNNHLYKIIGRRIMKHAEKANTIAVEQYGSRKRKSAILHATSKQLTLDIIRQLKQDASLSVLHAMACYDCITAPVSSLSML